MPLPEEIPLRYIPACGEDLARSIPSGSPRKAEGRLCGGPGEVGIRPSGAFLRCPELGAPHRRHMGAARRARLTVRVIIPAPHRKSGHRAAHGLARGSYDERVDSADVSAPSNIGTIGMVELDQPLPVASAHHRRDTDFV